MCVNEKGRPREAKGRTKRCHRSAFSASFSGILSFDEFSILGHSVIDFLLLLCAVAVGNSTGRFGTAKGMVTMAVSERMSPVALIAIRPIFAACSEASGAAAVESPGSFSHGHLIVHSLIFF